MPTPARPLRILVAFLLGLAAFLVAGPITPVATAATQVCSSSTTPEQRPLLRKGDTGSCVKVLQDLLVLQGYSLKKNGSFDAATDTAVRRFQHDRVGLVIDGVVTPETWSALVSGGTLYSIQRGPNLSDKVVLSFDDCPKDADAFQAAVLDAESLGIALVLMPTGDCLGSGRFDAALARTHGHYVFNHSVTHPHLTELSAKKVLAELGAPGVVTNYGRPPYGAYNTPTVRDAYAQRAMRIWTWDVDTRDWEGKSTDEVVAFVLENTTARDTVLMHMQWNGFNRSALSSIQAGLRALGLEVCHNQGQPTDVRPVLTC